MGNGVWIAVGLIMGSSVLGDMIDPVQAFAGRKSWLSKMDAYDPVMGSGAGKYLDPAAYSAGQGWKAQRNFAAAHPPAPGPYAGQAATLAGAQGGYPMPSASATHPAGQSALGVPRVPNVQTLMRGATSQNNGGGLW